MGNMPLGALCMCAAKPMAYPSLFCLAINISKLVGNFMQIRL